MDDTTHIHILDIEFSGHVHQWKSLIIDCNLRSQMIETDMVNATRLIIFDLHNYPYILDQIGTIYDIDPVFLRAAYLIRTPRGFYNGVSQCVPEFLAGGQPRNLDLGYGWAGVILPRYKDNCNLLLVSAPYSRNSPDVNPYGHGDEKSIYFGVTQFSKVYLEALLKRDNHFFVEAHKDPLRLLLPVLEIHATYLYEGLVYADRCLREGIQRRKQNPELVENAWSALRMMRHDGMRPFSCFHQYDNDHNDGKVQHSIEFKNLARRFRCIAEQISLTEALARDYLQHHIGLFSLEESRVSIKQSKVALEEGRRTKLVTVLAIFFVPISLSTSIFGMNINELNESGQSIWVFIVSTVMIVGATMMIWGFMYQFQKYNSLPRSGDSELKPWHTRSSCLLQLVFQGHII
ncbi:hypothetical protein F4806DRAFT_235606 [Annulohypoxylon nitens]|nr:hypothetical protein F4806DRAFT_235606 [Annulohypoxylon nitens]